MLVFEGQLVGTIFPYGLFMDSLQAISSSMEGKQVTKLDEERVILKTLLLAVFRMLKANMIIPSKAGLMLLSQY